MPAQFPTALDTPAFRAAWDEYLAYRRAQKFRTLKPVSITKQLSECASWGEQAAIESIKTTIRNGWQGLFEPKSGQGSGTRTRQKLSTDLGFDELCRIHGVNGKAPF